MNDGGDVVLDVFGHRWNDGVLKKKQVQKNG